MAKLKSIIPKQNYELVRDRIGLILADELACQFQLSSEVALNATVYLERGVGFDVAELSETSAVNVALMRGEYDEKDVETARGSYTYSVDCRVSKVSTMAEQGDVTAHLNLHRLMGACRAILENPVYKTLDFQPPSLNGVKVTAIEMADPTTDPDAQNVASGRLLVEVIVYEGVELLDAPMMALSTTIVKLHRTGKGYRYEVEDGTGSSFLDQDGNKFIAQDGIGQFSPIPENHFISEQGEVFNSQQGEPFEHG